MAYNIKKLKSYLVSGLVFYTVLVTYFLAQTAWNDDVTVKKRHGQDDKLLNVLYQEERRHLRSFKDVIQTYGGVVQAKAGGKLKREDLVKNVNDVKSGSVSPGRRFQSPYSTDFYVDDGNAVNGDVNHSTSNNVTDVFGNGSMAEAETLVQPEPERPTFDVEVESPPVRNSLGQDPYHTPDTGNIVIEEGAPNSVLKASNNSSVKTQSISSKEGVSKSKEKTLAGSHNKNYQKKVETSNSASNSSSTLTEYCDKIDAEEPHLCLSERITHSHHHHVNISSHHVSFKPLGDIYVYSAFLDTRRKPVSIRLMTLGPKGRNAVKRSGYWCAFSLPVVLSQQYYWNGRKEPFVARPDQATQMEYYAASDGHDRDFQFYIMTCTVPDKHLASMIQTDSSRIHLVTGGKDSPLLETVQERIAVDVLNNLGLPWQKLFNNSRNVVNRSDINTQDYPRTNLGKEKNKQTPGLANPRHSYSLNPNSIVSCVAPMFGGLGVVQMVEFLELTLLMGSQHIVVYTNHMTDDVRDILSVYRFHGLVTVLPWPIPKQITVWAKGRDIALNDCLYRTMYKYEFALFHDVDEYFVPRITPDLPSFINFLQSKGGLKTNKVSDIVFSSAYFPPPTKLQSKNLMALPGYTKDVSKFSSLRNIHRTYFNQHSVLRMIRPVMAFRVGAGERKKTVFTISPRYAGINHYSQCHGGSTNNSTTTKKMSSSNETEVESGKGSAGKSGISDSAVKGSKPGVVCGNTKVDMYLWRFKDRLIRKSKEIIRELNAKQRV